MTDTCSTCRFFHRKGSETTQFKDVDGMCRRRAPTGFTPETSGLLFPPMNSGQWCGDHETRSGAANDPSPAAPAQAIAA